ncbi:MAG: UDP-N-acetylmuramate dehydrogenase [Alloprevotella sp.]
MYSLLHHNTFGIDAQCRDFFEYTTVSQLLEHLPQLRQTQWLHIGSGSNLVFVHDFEGTIVHSAIQGIEVQGQTEQYVWLKVGAGQVWDDFVAECVARGYCGLENLSLIPGEVGAAAVQNIGAYGVEVCQYIDTVEAVQVSTGKLCELRGSECQYGYRSSIFKKEPAGQYIVTHVVFKLPLCFQPDLHYGAIARELQQRHIAPEQVTPAVLRDLVVEVRRAKLPDPAEIGSAGSFFMNPVVSADTFRLLQRQYPDMPHYVVENGVKIPAGWLIEQCGWKGRSIGPAGVYAKQALVLVNLGGATGSDILRLARQVQDDVKHRFGITITPEANIIS